MVAAQAVGWSEMQIRQQDFSTPDGQYSSYCFWKRAGLACFYDSEIVKFGLREISKCAESQGSFEAETKQ